LNHPIADLILTKISKDGRYSEPALKELRPAFEEALADADAMTAALQAIGLVRLVSPAAAEQLRSAFVGVILAGPHGPDRGLTAAKTSAALASFEGRVVAPRAVAIHDAAPPEGSKRPNDLNPLVGMIRP
jgi:hypothetical protein